MEKGLGCEHSPLGGAFSISNSSKCICPLTNRKKRSYCGPSHSGSGTCYLCTLGPHGRPRFYSQSQLMARCRGAHLCSQLG